MATLTVVFRTKKGRRTHSSEYTAYAAAIDRPQQYFRTAASRQLASALILFIFNFTSRTLNSPPSWDESVFSGDQPFSRYTLCIFVSRSGSVLPHRVNLRQPTLLTTLYIHILTRSMVESYTTEEKLDASGFELTVLSTNGNIRTVTPSGRGGKRTGLIHS